MNNSSIIIADLNTNDSITNSGIAYGAKFNTVFNAYEKKSGELVVLVKALINEAANRPNDFAGLLAGFASKINRTSWNSVSTFFRTTAKKEGYKVSLTCDRNEKNNKACLIKASFEKIDIVAAQAASKAASKAPTDVSPSASASADKPTQKQLLSMISELLEQSTTSTKQALFVKLGKELENHKIAPKKAPKKAAKKAPVNAA